MSPALGGGLAVARACAPATARRCGGELGRDLRVFDVARRGGGDSRSLGQALIDNRGRVVHAAGQIAVDRWQGEERVQLRVVDLAAA